MPEISSPSDPIPVLHFPHNQPRNLPVRWSWSKCAVRPNGRRQHSQAGGGGYAGRAGRASRAGIPVVFRDNVSAEVCEYQGLTYTLLSFFPTVWSDYCGDTPLRTSLSFRNFSAATYGNIRLWSYLCSLTSAAASRATRTNSARCSSTQS